MEQHILDYVKNKFSSEQYDLFMQVVNLFETMEVPGYEDRISLIVNAGANLDSAEPTDLILNALDYYLTKSLDEMDVSLINTINEDPNMIEVKYNFLNALYLLGNYEQKSEIIAILDAYPDDHVEALCQCFTLVSVIPPDEYMIVVDDVGESLVRRLYEISKDETEFESDADPDLLAMRAEISKRIKSYLTMLGHKNLIGVEFVRDGGYVGTDFKTYFNIHLSAFRDMDHERLPEEILFFGLLSHDGYKEPLNLIRDISDSLFDNLTDNTKFMNAVTKLYTRMA